jgi:uncharacterized membrane protein
MNPAHLHLILNHLPVLGTAFGLAILAFGLWKKNEAIKRLALATLVIIALSAIPAYLTGEPAEDVVKGLPGVAMSLVERHEEAAGVALGGVLALGALALAGLVIFRGQRPVANWFGLLTLLAAVVVTGLMAYTANLGGQVHHPEIRSGAPASLPGEPNHG